MSSIMWQKLNNCLSKIKCLSPSLPSNDEHESPNSLLTTINNFNSLYSHASTPMSVSYSDDNIFTSDESNADQVFDHSDDTAQSTPPDFSTIFASQERFFFSSPGQSNSIFECTSQNNNTPLADKLESLVNDSVAFLKYSPDPYKDFRQSMQEMVKAKEHLINVEDKCEYMHELLMCYLSLNPKRTHNYIISAFSDLIVTLLSEERSETISDVVPRRRKVSRQLLF